jgi:L,D-transpeptidase catalytic domain
MSVTSLQNKTVRPGSLTGYSYYYSSRRPLSAGKAPRPKMHAVQVRPFLRWALLAILLLGLLIFGPILLRRANDTVSSSSGSLTPSANSSNRGGSAAPAVTTAGPCAGNQLNQFILVSISQRHLWACQGSRAAYDTPVVTGIDYLAADKTPAGTYHIYGKVTNTTLTGSDSTGAWSDSVKYWMPFLRNQYGTYGLHDATWRAGSAFGNISPNSADASHGCVELPLSAASWLYNWASVGTTVTVKS